LVSRVLALLLGVVVNVKLKLAQIGFRPKPALGLGRKPVWQLAACHFHSEQNESLTCGTGGTAADVASPMV
jgi:hypothetical protein